MPAGALSSEQVFAEVKVDPDLGQIRVTRLVGAFAAGRIIWRVANILAE